MSSRLGIAGIVLLAAFGLAACGGGGGTTASTDDDTAMEQTPQQMCEAAGGRWNADGTCTSAADLAAETAATTKAALTKETAIAAEAAQTTDAGLGGDAATQSTSGAEGEYTLAIARDRSGTTVTITVEGASDAADEDFVQAMDLGGGLTMHTREGEMGVEEVAMVMTDIEAPKATAFADQYELNANMDGSNNDGSDDANPPTARSIVGTDDDTRAMIMAALLTAPVGKTTVDIPHEDDATTEGVKDNEFAGTFDGAPGTYICVNSGSACVATFDGEDLTNLTGTLIFIPADGAIVYVDDADYLHYGFWLKRTTGEDGAVTYDEVETFAGTNIAPSGSTAAVEGTANYEGGAAGVYVHKTFATDGTSEATSGHFTAAASLEMNFGGNDIPVNSQNRLTGTISGFMLSGGEENDWTVTLQSDGEPGTEGIQPDTDGVLAGTAKGGGDGDGSFSATFHGPVTDSDNNPIQPHTLVGEFNSVFTNGSVAGGFGARKAE